MAFVCPSVCTLLPPYITRLASCPRCLQKTLSRESSSPTSPSLPRHPIATRKFRKCLSATVSSPHPGALHLPPSLSTSSGQPSHTRVAEEPLYCSRFFSGLARLDQYDKVCVTLRDGPVLVLDMGRPTTSPQCSTTVVVASGTKLVEDE